MKYFDIIPPERPVDKHYDLFKRLYENNPMDNFEKYLKQIERLSPQDKYTPKREGCLHKQCSECHGTGHTRLGSICIHMISCPCPSCSPRMMVIQK
jgi:hypothetical protein